MPVCVACCRFRNGKRPVCCRGKLLRTLSTTREGLLAVCHLHGGLCTRSRTLNNSDRSDRLTQGRPVGELTAWLRAGARNPEMTELQHTDLEVADHTVRLAERDWFRGLPASNVWFERERDAAAKDGGGLEPLVLPKVKIRTI